MILHVNMVVLFGQCMIRWRMQREIPRMKSGDDRQAVIVDNSSGHHKDRGKYIICY